MTDICQYFRACCPGFLISWHCNVNNEAGLFFIADQHNDKPIVKHMLVSLDGKVPEDLGLVIPDYFFWLNPPILTVLKVILSTYSPVYY